MPYVYDPNLDPDEEDQNGLPSGASEVKLSEGSSSNEQMASGASPQGQQKELNTGSGYQNLDKYLNTNQSQQFGQKVLGKVEGTVDTAKQNQAQAADQFKNQVNTANYTPDQEKLNQTLASPEQGNPKDFQKWMNQSYEGPKSLAEDQNSWNKYWSGTNQANTNAKMLGTEPGRFSLLDSYFGRPQYNFGEKSLDNLLVQQSGLGKQTRNLQNQATLLKSQGEEQAKNLQGVAAQRSAQVDQSRNQVNDAFNQAETGIKDEIAKAVEQANLTRSSDQGAIRDAIANGYLSDDQLSRMGLSRGQKAYNLNLSDYLNIDPSALTGEQVASDTQRSRINALAQLAGIDQTDLGEKQAMSDAYGFDSGRFLSDVGGRENAYNTQNTALTTQAQNLQSELDKAIAYQEKLGHSDPNKPFMFKPNADRFADPDIYDRIVANERKVADLRNQISQTQSGMSNLTNQYNINRRL